MSLLRLASKGHEPALPGITSGTWDRTTGGEAFADSSSNWSFLTSVFNGVGSAHPDEGDRIYAWVASDTTDSSYTATWAGATMTITDLSGSSWPGAIEQTLDVTHDNNWVTDPVYASTSATNFVNSTHVCLLLDRGWTETQYVDTAGGSGMPNCPSVTGVATDDYVFLVGFLDRDKVEASVTAPSGFTLYQVKEVGTSTGSTIMTAFATGLSGTVDPDAFGGTGSDSWWGSTYVFSPV